MDRKYPNRRPNSGRAQEATGPSSGAFERHVLAEAGDAGAQILAKDWANSSLGPIATWPDSLRTVLSVCLRADAPTLIWWGREPRLFYNEAYLTQFAHRSGLREQGALAAESWPEGLRWARDALSESFAGNSSIRYGDAHMCPDEDGQRARGAIRYAHTPLIGEREQIVAVCTVLVRELERAPLVEHPDSAETLRQLLFEQSPLAFFLVSGPAHRFELANERYMEMVHKRDLIGKAMAEAFPEVVGTPLMEVFDRVYRTGEPFVSDEYMVGLERSDSSIVEPRYFRFNLVAMHDRAGDVMGLLCTSIEISDQVRARKDEEASRRLLEIVLEQMHTGVIVAEAPSGNTLFVNRAVERMLGPPPSAALTTQNYRGYPAFHANGRAYVARDYPIAAVLRGERLIEHEVSVLDGFGNLRAICVSATPAFDARGELVAAVMTVSDITERRDAEQQRRDLLMQAEQARAQAEQVSRAKDEFMAILGHELRNPLSPITTALYLMEKRGDDKTARERGIIQRQVDRLIRLVDELLDASRVTGGKVRLKKRVVELTEVTQRALEMTGPVLEERGHRLIVEVPAHGLTVHGDLERLAQAVRNLLLNAAKYTPKGGRVTMDGRRQQDDVVLTVRDTGVGIAPTLLPRVFELFVQEPQALDRSRGGLGLGLSIVQSLVHLHGGTVSAHSDGEGQGSAFVMRFPFVPAAPPLEPAAAPLPAAPVGTASELDLPTRRILVVDDNQDAADTLAAALESLGQEARVAYDGASGLRIAAELRPALALLDIGLPAMDGYELAGKLRALLGRERVRLVALTGYGQTADRERAFASGFDAHVVKPLSPDALEAILADLAAEDPAP